MAWASAGATEPDTIWTQGPNLKCWFTPSGTHILSEYTQIINVSDGSVVWDSAHIIGNGYFSQDSLYFYDILFAKYRISDGVKVSDKPNFYFDTLPDFFKQDGYWDIPRIHHSANKVMMDDENIFYYLYYQDSLDIDQDKVGSRSLLCKYDKSLDSIVLYKPLLLNGDTNIRNKSSSYGNAELIGYVSQNNTVLVRFYDDSTYRQYNASTLDSVSQFIYDRKSNGWVSEHKISYNGKYLGMGTSDGESDLGWIIIYDLTNNSIYNKFLNGDSTTSKKTIQLAFSRNDSFLVTAGSSPTTAKTWNFHTGSHIHSYEHEYSLARSLDVSPDNTKIIVPGPMICSLLRARWTPVTSVEEESEAPELMLVYPNPAGDYVEINIPPLERGSGGVSVFDVLGIKRIDSRLRGNDSQVIRIEISSLSPGVYFVSVGGRMYKFVKM